MSAKAKERIRMILFMFVITFVFISAVSALHLATKERVLQNETLFLKQAVLVAAGRDLPAEREAVLDLYEQSVSTFSGSRSNKVFSVRNPQGTIEGYVLVCDGTGLWGTIAGVVGMDADLKRFTGLTFVAQNETPGLGARISEEWFGKQFSGKQAPLTYVAEGTPDTKATEFEAITGATITTKAVRNMMNTAATEAVSIVQGPEGAN